MQVSAERAAKHGPDYDLVQKHKSNLTCRLLSNVNNALISVLVCP